MNNYDYPLGSDTPEAPWNDPGPQPDQEIEVEVTITLSKRFKIKVNDYEVFKDDFEKEYYTSYRNCDLISAVKDQVYLPNEYGDVMLCRKSELDEIQAIRDAQNWNVEELEVELI